MTKRVKIDPGHGGKDSGAVKGGLIEKNMNLVSALAAKEVLEDHGVIVELTRTTDVYLELSERARRANAFKADLFVSIHYNAGGGDGGEVIHSVVGGVGEQLAKKITARFVKDLGQNLRPNPTYARKNSKGTDYYAVIREAKMPTVITEAAFIDSKDAELVDTVAEQQKVGQAIAHGILDQLGISVKAEKPVAKPVSKPVTEASKACECDCDCDKCKKTGTPSKLGVITASSLNLRKGPGTTHAVVSTFKQGDELVILAEENGWYKVSCGTHINPTGYAYVSKTYVKIK